MKFLQKQHKGLKIKEIFNSNFVFIFHHNGFTVNEQNTLKKVLLKYNLNSTYLNQKIASKVLKETKYKNIVPLLNGPILVIYGNFNDTFTTFDKIIKSLNKSIDFIALKMENTYYSKTQMDSIIKKSKPFHFNSDDSLKLGSLRSLINILTLPKIQLVKTLEVASTPTKN